MRSEPRVVIITNASTEIGRAATMGMAAGGDRVAASTRDLERSASLEVASGTGQLTFALPSDRRQTIPENQRGENIWD